MYSREIGRLEKQIVYHNQRYFQENNPEISDKEYDSLLLQLKELDPKNKLLNSVSDSADFKTFRKISRDKPMLSLDKITDPEILCKWLHKWKSPVCVMPKVDGCALELRYDTDGELELAATRGDGSVGEDVSFNAIEVNGVPRCLPVGPVEIRGEVYMSKETFESFPEDKFSNPRNAAAGGLRQKDPSITREYNLQFIAYDIIDKGGLEEVFFEDELRKLHVLKSLGFTVVPYTFLRPPGLIVHPEKLRDSLVKITDEEALSFPTDGIVYKVSDKSEQEKSGYTSHHPKYAVAYKFEDEKYQTVLEDVLWQVSRLGRINPVAVFKPVDIDGVKVSKASLHSLSNFLDLCPAIGSTIEVSRRGGVIPYVESVIKRTGEPIPVPEKCPSCFRDTKVVGEFLYCSNEKTCFAVVQSYLLNFVNTFEIDGVGPEILKILYNEGIVKTPKDFYTITFKRLREAEFGEKTAENVMRSIKESQNNSVPKLLASMNIPGLGLQTAKQIWDYFGEFIFNAHALDIEGLTGIGRKKAVAIRAGIQDKIDDISFIMQFLDCSQEKKTGILEGQTFLFTGALSRPRKEFHEIVIEYGGTIASGVSKNLDYLICGESTKESSKLKKAKDMNVNIISEKEFLTLIEE